MYFGECLIMQLFRERIGSKRLTEARKTINGGKIHRDMDLFKDYYLTPHEEMEKCLQAYNTDGLISSAVDSLTDFFMGNDFKVDGDDKATNKFFDGMIDNMEPSLFESAREAVENTIKTGNGYVEVEYDKNGLPIKFFPVADSSRIYINCDPFGQPLKKVVFDSRTGERKYVWDTEEYYIQRVPDNFDEKGTGLKAKWYSLSYYHSNFKEIKIRGIPIPKKNLIHFKWGTGDLGVYGRSFIASVLDDHEILKRMEKAMGIIAKYKAVPKKIISPKDGDEFSNEESEELATYFEGLEDDENAVLTKPIEQSDLSYAGKDINFSGTIDHVRRKIISGLTPEFLIGYGMDTNRATADQMLIAFMLRLETKRKIWERQWTSSLIKPYLFKYGDWMKKAEISFGDLDFRTPAERNNEIRAKWTSNQVTYNEMREELEKPKHENGNIFYKDFIQQGLEEEEKSDYSLPQGAKALSPPPVQVKESILKRAEELRSDM